MWRAGGISLAALALFCSTAAAESLNGRWVGSYVCAQGLTGLTLTIAGDEERDGSHPLQAHFSFYALPDNPDVPSGAFSMYGFHMDGDRVILRADQWIDRPGIYEMVNLLGAVKYDANGEAMRGDVLLPAARHLCTRFELCRETGLVS